MVDGTSGFHFPTGNGMPSGIGSPSGIPSGICPAGRMACFSITIDLGAAMARTWKKGS